MQAFFVARGIFFGYGRRMIGAHEAAAMLGVAPCTLRKWRALGIGPAFEWREGRARYDEAVIAAYVHHPRKPGRPKGAKDSRPRERRAAGE